MTGLKDRIEQFDFIKGIAVISVILLHSFWFNDKIYSIYSIGQAVPLFITVSCVLGCLTLSKGGGIKNYFAFPKTRNMLKRIFLPFFMAEILIVIPFVISGNFNIKNFIGGGGYGAGSYYPWVYFQLWILLPFMYALMKTLFMRWGIILSFSIVSDIIFSLVIQKEWLYRLFTGRYLFIFVLAFLMVEGKIKYKYLLLLAFIGAGFAYFHQYKKINMEPIFYSSWYGDKFPVNFYTMIVFMFIYKTFDFIPLTIRNIMCKIGVNSWKIFLMQMIYFAFCGGINLNPYINVLLALFICIVPIYTFDFMAKPIKIVSYKDE